MSKRKSAGAVVDGLITLNFMNFEVVGSVVAYDSSSFAPDLAFTATSVATGHKTYSGSINVDETATVKYLIIVEKVHSQLGMSADCSLRGERGTTARSSTRSRRARANPWR